MQNYDGQFELNGQEYFYRATYCEQNNLELEKIFNDQQTGKNFNRPRYQVLKEDVLRAGDE